MYRCAEAAVVLGLTVLGGGVLRAQSAAPVTQSMNEMLERAKPMLAQAAKSGGTATAIFQKYPGHFTELVVRTSSGGGELHKRVADFLFVVDGEATEMTGGTVVEPKDTEPGEVRGTRLEGATPHPLHKGEWIHIPAGTPHQAVLAPGKTLTLYVIKVEEVRP